MYKTLAILIAFAISHNAAAQSRLLDSFESLAGWKAIASDGVRIDVAIVEGRTDKCIKIDFDFVAGAGYCGIQKHLPMALPENFQFAFYLRGEAPTNNLEFKLVDASGDNVWWLNQRNFEFPSEWTKIAIKKRHISFAWGPTTDRSLKAFDKVEFFVASSTGSKGSIYIDDFTFQELEPPADTLPTPVINAATRAGNKDKLNLIPDGNSQTQWRSASKPEQQGIMLDLGKSCEFGGLIIDWDQQDFARARIASDFPRGYFPKYLQHEQSYWTVVGVNNDTKEALINEEGICRHIMAR